MKKYSRLSAEDREEISCFLFKGHGVREISRAIKRSPSTVSREINKSKGHSYRAFREQKRSQKRASSRKLGKRKITQNKELAKIIESKLKLRWSPEQIARWLKREYKEDNMQVSHETIYSYIYVLGRGELKKELMKYLRREHKKRRVQGHSQKGQTANLPEMLSIEERPKEVEDRIIPGHWEGDIIIGGRMEQSAMGTLVERTTRTVLLVPLKNKTAEEVRKAFTREIKKLPEQMRLTLTYDQGREMAQHKLFTKNTKMKVYFAHPRSPWERGTNENTNGLIRQFFPKGTNFREVSRYRIKRVQHLLNGRPRKALNWETPYEAMEKLLR